MADPGKNPAVYKRFEKTLVGSWREMTRITLVRRPFLDHPNTRQKDSAKWKRAPFEKLHFGFWEIDGSDFGFLPLRIMAGFFWNKICTVGVPFKNG